MSVFYDYGEFLICILPPFLIIATVGLLLLANSWPSKKSVDQDTGQDEK